MAITPQQDDLVQIDVQTELEAPQARAKHTPVRSPGLSDERIPAFAYPAEFPPVELSPKFAAEASADRFDIGDYLAGERAKDLLRLSTAGSVDDGKSTLIGRLLYDTQSVYDDQISSIEGKGTTAPGVLDLALLTDGLRAEREQGITIDVAYRYFSTARRKFIIADTPGHEQYTRNMATGASTADVAIVLVDARKGVLVQSRRHAYITSLLGVRHVIVAVNKMDLVGYSEETFNRIVEQFSAFFAALDIDGHQATELHFVPLSALAGDNVVHGAGAMTWYTGPPLLHLLESIPPSEMDTAAPFRMSVQRVIRPNLDFRGFAGQIAAGAIRTGDRILALPSGRTSRVARIVTFDGDLDQAVAPLSITLTFEDELDISRGDLLVSPEAPAAVTSAFTASLVWMDTAPLDLNSRYLLKHTSRTVPAQVRRLLHTVDLAELEQRPSGATLAMNDIGLVAIETSLPLAADPYAINRRTGSFVLIDARTNATVAAGMIRETGNASTDGRSRDALPNAEGTSSQIEAFRQRGPVTETERIARYGHTGAHLALHGPGEFAEAVERALFDQGAGVVLLHRDEAAVSQLTAAGLLVITIDRQTAGDSRFSAEILGSRTELDRVAEDGLSAAVQATLHLLLQTGVLRLQELL